MDTQPQKYFNILVIGDGCIDQFHYGVCERLSPEAPVPVFKHVRTEQYGGMMHNVCSNLSAFHDVKIDKLTNTEEIRKERFVDVRTNQHLLRADYGEDKKVSFLCENLLESTLSKKKYDAIIVSDYDKGFISNTIADIISSKKIPVFVDTKKKDYGCYQNCILKINEAEFERAKEYWRKTSLEKTEVIVTLGGRGARWREKIYPTVPREAFDVSGAGDTFLASFVYSFLKSEGDMEKAIMFANQCSGIVVQKKGTYSLTAEDICGIRI